MSFESITNRAEYLSAHYLSEILPDALKRDPLKAQAEARQAIRAGIKRYRGDFFTHKAEFADLTVVADVLRKHHQELLRALGFEPRPQTLMVERNGREYEVQVAHSENGIVALDCGWAVEADAAHDPDDAGRLLEPVVLDGSETIEAGPNLASWLFGIDNPPRYVLLLGGAVVTLAGRTTWGEGRYLAVNFDLAYARNQDRELEIIAALFGATSLRPPAEGGSEPLVNVISGSRQHAVGVSSELREGLRLSVEIIANEVLDRIRERGYQPEQVKDLGELAEELRHESLRYLYRILFLLYAEARPELGVLPVNDPEYAAGYSLARLGDLVARRLDPATLRGFHLYESLDLLFRMVNDGHRPRAGVEAGEKDSEAEGLRFEPMRSDLFLEDSIKLIGHQIAVPSSDPDDPHGPKLDTRLRDSALYRVLRLLMITKGDRRKRGGFISYAQLGINQLGAVYEGLMSYTGFVATEPLYEVAKNGDPKDGSWMIPASKVNDYDDSVFVSRENPITGIRSRVEYRAGQFVYRLAGRDRQTSASYYTPQSLTEVTVQLALKYRLDQDGTTPRARELLDWTICEPALGSGAFLNEAINQVAAEYLRRRQEELKTALDPEQYHLELQRVKAYIALHNCYGVDLNRTAVELAEVSLWLNVMHAGLQAPWFGLHLRRGNSLIGGRRQVYRPEQVTDKSWLTTAPADVPLRDKAFPEGAIHHFLLPADGWGAVAGEKEAKELAPQEAETLKKWRNKLKAKPTPKQLKRLQGLAARVEYLWELVQQRLTISEGEIRRHIPVWQAEDLPAAEGAVPREKILKDLQLEGTPYWRLKALMDTWCALWFWPLHSANLLDGTAEIYTADAPEVTRERTVDTIEEPTVYSRPDLFGTEAPVQPTLPKLRKQKVTFLEQLTRATPLSNLDDWLTFAEALVGRKDFSEDGLFKKFTTLAELDEHEDGLAANMGMDEPYRLGERFPWLDQATKIADEQGFFHWELTFAQAFTNGGFDLQVGNPPWVRPDWKEGTVLAEHEPWFQLVEKAPTELWRDRKADLLQSPFKRNYFLAELASNAGMVALIGDPVTYPLLTGTRPDLYRAFMCQVWRNLGDHGNAGLIHPDTHLIGTREGLFRAATYPRVRVHGGFVNVSNWAFDDATAKLEFGLHVYGHPREIKFLHLSQMFAARTLPESLNHDGSGPVPGQKFEGSWDRRPHSLRVMSVDVNTLKTWQQLRGETDKPVVEAPILYPVTVREESAIAALAGVRRRVSDLKPNISGGYNETTSRKAGEIRWAPSKPHSSDELVLQGPHIGIANPVAKVPKVPYRSNNDWDVVDLVSIPHDYVALTNYVVTRSEAEMRQAQDNWDGRPYTYYYRLAWRAMIPVSTERSLFAALIPPGPSHTNGIYSMALRTSRETSLCAGLWSGLPLDYLLRITGKVNLHPQDLRAFPAPDSSHPLADEMLLRTLRLNCMTKAYSELWRTLFKNEWLQEHWAVDWPSVAPLAHVGNQWTVATPLRAELPRRAALVEIDALVATWLGIGIEELIAILRSRYSILTGREDKMWFDANGRKIAADPYAFGFGQTKEHYEQLQAHLNHGGPVPDGYMAPFYKADRETEYRQAHAVFSKRLQDAIDNGWSPE